MVSIIIPVFNREKALIDTLNSILGQTHPNWECILVDDGSTDDTLLIIDTYVLKDKRFKVFSRPNNRIKGPSTCRNIGLEKAKGDYIIYLDSDDLLAEFCLEERIKAFELHKDADFLVFEMQTFAYEVPLIVKEQLVERDEEDWLSNFMQLRGSWQTTAPIYKTIFAKKIGGFSEEIMIFEDFEIAIRALFLSSKYHTFKNVDYFYRNDDNYFKKHVDITYERKVVASFVTFLSLVHNNVVVFSDIAFKNKFRENLLIAYSTIFNRYIIPNVGEFKSSNKKMITFLFKCNYISTFKFAKFLFVQHFLFKFYKFKGFGLYRFIKYLMH